MIVEITAKLKLTLLIIILFSLVFCASASNNDYEWLLKSFEESDKEQVEVRKLSELIHSQILKDYAKEPYFFEHPGTQEKLLFETLILRELWTDDKKRNRWVKFDIKGVEDISIIYLMVDDVIKDKFIVSSF